MSFFSHDLGWFLQPKSANIIGAGKHHGHKNQGARQNGSGSFFWDRLKKTQKPERKPQ
jgi:hypothetical protein